MASEKFSIKVWDTEKYPQVRHALVRLDGREVYHYTGWANWHPTNFRVEVGGGLNEWPYYLMYEVGSRTQGFGFTIPE